MATLLDECGWTEAQLDASVAALAHYLAEQHITNRQVALTLTAAMLALAARSEVCLDTVERDLGLALAAILVARGRMAPAQVSTAPPDAAGASQIVRTIDALGMTADDAAEGLKQCAHALLKEKPASRPALLRAMRDMIHEFAAN